MKAEKNNSGVKPAVILLAALVILAAAFFVVYKTLTVKPVEGGKTITIEIIHPDRSPRTVSVETDSEYLIDALRDGGIVFEGEEGSFGFFITSFDGYVPDDSNEEWWGYTKSGEYVETGIDQTVIMDGDKYEFTLNTGYDF